MLTVNKRAKHNSFIKETDPIFLKNSAEYQYRRRSTTSHIRKHVTTAVIINNTLSQRTSFSQSSQLVGTMVHTTLHSAQRSVESMYGHVPRCPSAANMAYRAKRKFFGRRVTGVLEGWISRSFALAMWGYLPPTLSPPLSLVVSRIASSFCRH